MTTPSDTVPPEPGRGPTVPGKIFVPVFVAVLTVAVVAAVTFALRVRPVAMSARAKTFPLSATLNAHCRLPGVQEPSDVRLSGHCAVGGTLLLDASAPGSAAKYVGYALVGETPAESPLTGQFEIGQEGQIPLSTRTSGPHTVVFFVAENPVDLEEMKHALSLARPGDLGDELLRLEQFRTVIRKGGNDARVERLRFVVDPA